MVRKCIVDRAVLVETSFSWCLFSFWTCHTAASPWVCCQWSCERTAALFSQSSQSGGMAAEVTISQTWMHKNKSESTQCFYSAKTYENLYHYTWKWSCQKIKIWQIHLAFWLGYIEWMCWPNNTCDWSCRFSTWSESLRLCVSVPGSQKGNISSTVHSKINSKLMEK